MIDDLNAVLGRPQKSPLASIGCIRLVSSWCEIPLTSRAVKRSGFEHNVYHKSDFVTITLPCQKHVTCNKFFTALNMTVGLVAAHLRPAVSSKLYMYFVTCDFTLCV